MNIVIVGLGGTGSCLAEPLVRYLYGEGIIEHSQITFVDGDHYDEGNITRQMFATGFIGTNKAEYTHLKMTKLFPEFESHFSFIPKYLGADDLVKLMTEDGVLFSCVDNHYFRKIADEQAALMGNYLLISAGNGMVDGNVQSVLYQNRVCISKQTLRSKHSDVRDAQPKEDRSKMSCEDIAKIPGGGQIVVANMMAASLMLCHFIANWGKVAPFYETYFNCERCGFNTVDIKK